MSWQATIARTERNGDILNVIIQYVDDTNREYTQTITISNKQGDDYLSGVMAAKLNQLNGLDVYETSVKASDVVNGVSTVADSGGLTVTPSQDSPQPEPVTIIGGTK